MDHIRIDPLIDGRPKMRKAGWWACRVFELLLKVSGKYDLRGSFSSNYSDPEWLADEWGLKFEDLDTDPGQAVDRGLSRLVQVGLLERRDLMSIVMPGWEEFYGKKDLSTPRSRAFRERQDSARATAGEDSARDIANLPGTAGTAGTAHTPPTSPTNMTAERLKEAWNNFAKAMVGHPLLEDRTLKHVLKLGGDRQRLAEARAKEYPTEEFWADLFIKVGTIPFLLGHNDRKWMVNFDFLMRPISISKVLEGTYDNLSKPKATVKLVALPAPGQKGLYDD